MTTAVPAREKLTTLLVTTLRAGLAELDSPIGLGDGIAPEDYGWPQGQPGKGVFKPYAVLKTLVGTLQPTPTLASDPAWRLGHQITSWGSLREQADYVADLAINLIAGLKASELRGDDAPVPGFAVQQILIGPLGTTDRTDQVAPQMWSRTDTLTVWLARARRA